MTKNLPSIEIYGSMECPYAYLMTFRLGRVWPEFEGRLQIAWRALSLEYINRAVTSKRALETEKAYFHHLEPELPLKPWGRHAWEWPATSWPAFEALACAQAQGPEAGFAMSWTLRHGLFFEDRCLAMRHELMLLAEEAATISPLDLDRFESDWDHGRYKASVIAECRRGWHDLKVDGSATIILPDGRQYTNPGIGEIRFNEVTGEFLDYVPPERDPLETYREILRQAVKIN